MAVAASIGIVMAGVLAAPDQSPANASVAAAPKAPNNLSRQFLIGVWRQYPGMFDYWHALGINTMIGVPVPPQGWTQTRYAAGWDAAISRAGLLEVREPVNDRPSTDPGRTTSRIIAWMLPDEPENQGAANRPISSSAIAAMYRADKATNPTRPVWLSLIGGPLAGRYGIPGDQAYANWSDWLSADDYPITDRRNKPIQDIGKEMDGLSQVGSPGEGRLAFIEPGQIAPGRPTVTPTEMRGEIWEAVVHGARGVVYYAYDLDGTRNLVVSHNNTSAETRKMMQSQDWLLSHLPTSALQGPINPAGFRVSATSPIDTGWRASSAGKYFIVVNTSPTPLRATLKFGGVGGNRYLSVFAEHRFLWVDRAGYSSDTIPGYGEHIYYIH